MPKAAAEASKHTPAPTSLLLNIEFIANIQLPNPVISEPHMAVRFNISCSFPVLIAQIMPTIQAAAIMTTITPKIPTIKELLPYIKYFQNIHGSN
jgi:hypothetical protein